MSEIPLIELELGVQTTIADRCAIKLYSEQDKALRATLIHTIATSFIKILERKVATYPVHWERFLKRKDCPEYMKKLVTYDVVEHYPEVKMPKNWMSLQKNIQ